MPKVLIITYYWPPSGGAGVQRWLKFSKYLHEFGWSGIVYTPENPEAPATDHSLLADVSTQLVIIKRPIWEPYRLYKVFTRQKKDQPVNAGFLSETKKPGLAERFSVWLRGNLFIPDARRFWIRPSTRFLKKYLQEKPVDLIVSTGPPHSMHLIAMALHRSLGVPWVADFRDPWTNIDYYKDLMLTRRADNRHRKLEKKVLQSASHVITIGESMKNEFAALGAKNISVITNGYDEADFNAGHIIPGNQFSIVHIGSINRDRNPRLLWQCLSELVKENNHFAESLQIRLVGKTDLDVWNDLEKMVLMPYVERIDYLPHSEAVKEMFSAQVLLLLINNSLNAKGILTGKFFEYLASRRPILAVGPVDGDIASILKETGMGSITGFDDKEGMLAQLKMLFSLYEKGELSAGAGNTLAYSRRELTRRLTHLFNQFIS